MIFLPNKYERYTAALRNYIQRLALTKGITDELILKFRKIYEFETVFLYHDKLPCDLKLLCSKILISAYSKLLDKNVHLDFSINLTENYILNVRLFTVFLLKVLENSTEIKIYENLGFIILKSKSKPKIKPIFLKQLKAFSFYESKTETTLIVIKAEKTSKTSVDTKREWDFSNPFSPVNLYF